MPTITITTAAGTEVAVIDTTEIDLHTAAGWNSLTDSVKGAVVQAARWERDDASERHPSSEHEMQKFTANVLLPHGPRKIQAVAADLQSLGFDVHRGFVAGGIIVQAEAEDVEDFLADLEDALPETAIIDDHGEAG